MRVKTLCSTFFLTLFLTGMTVMPVGAQQATVSVFPASYTVPDIGLTFTVNITVQNVHDLYGWELKLYYPNDILNGTSVTEGPFLKTEGIFTFFQTPEFKDSYNETHGRLTALCLRIGEVPGVDGNGVLATITFNSTSTNGPEALHLDNVELSDSDADKIPCTTVDGEITVIPEFPAALILPLLTVLTSVAIALKKTAWSTKHVAKSHSTTKKTSRS